MIKMQKLKFPLKRKDKRGWLKIVEAFIAMMLITVVLLNVVSERTDFLTQGSQESIYETYREDQISILRNIQLNNSMRNSIIGIPDSELDVNWSEFPTPIKKSMEKNIPEYLNCSAKICSLESVCEKQKNINKDVFVEKRGIFSNLTEYNPRKLKLFCWEK